MERIKHFFDQIVDMSNEDWALFSSKLKKVEFPKKTIILERGKVEKHLSFIEKGIVRFNIPKMDYDLTFSFTFENSFVSAYDSFVMQLPCMYNMETITDCALWQISYEDLQIIYSQTKVGEKIGRKFAELLFYSKSRREISLLESTAHERYLALLKEQPHLIQQIPLKYLASFIGVRPQSLSRIRKKIS